MTTHRLSFFGYNGLVFRGTLAECQMRAELVNKWDSVHTTIEEEFGDEECLFGDHYIILLFENDAQAMRQIEEVYQKTKKIGKTSVVNDKKVDYLERQINKIIRNNYARLVTDAGENPKDFFPLSGVLTKSFINFYFAEHDREVGFKPLPYFLINSDYKRVLDSALLMEKVNKGKVPTLTPNLFPNAHEAKLSIGARSEECATLTVEWKNLPKGKIFGLAPMLYHHAAWSTYPARDNDTLKKLRKAVGKNSRISWMNTPENLYGDENNWYYIHISWAPEDFNQEAVRRAEKAIKELIEPKVLAS